MNSVQDSAIFSGGLLIG